jgi:shikimate kinase
MSEIQPLFLIGFMGSGKSTVGRLIAERLERPFCDLDEEIEIAEGRSIDELFERVGEEGFRDLERLALMRVGGHRDAVIACGGGVVTDEGSRAMLRDFGQVVYLAVTPEEALRRVGSEYAGRPLLRGSLPLDRATSLMSGRERLYASTADLTIPTVGHTPEAIADRIIVILQLLLQ